jgi:hypothetical protein
LCVPTPRFEWPSESPESGEANVWHNAIVSELRRWPPAEPIADGQRAKCSRALCQRLPLERHRSQMEVAVSWCAEMGEDIRSRARGEPHAGKSRPVETASSPKTSQKWPWRGLVDLSTISNSSTPRSVLPLSVVDNSAFSPTGLTAPSDASYDEETFGAPMGHGG